MSERDEMLREMAENRGCKLVKSRRRKPGAGDYGRYGLKDSKSGKEVLGFGKSGLTASADEVEQFLRGSLRASWKSSIQAAGKAARAEKPAPAAKVRQPAARESKTPPPAPRPAPIPPPPPPPTAPLLRVREARPKDAEAISDLIAELKFEASAAEVSRRLKQLAKSDEPVLVAEQGALVGCVTWHVTPVVHRPNPVGRITMLVVAASARRRGAGKALVEEVEARLAERGCGLVEATSNVELSGAHDFYRRLGFERTSYRFARKIRARREEG